MDSPCPATRSPADIRISSTARFGIDRGSRLFCSPCRTSAAYREGEMPWSFVDRCGWRWHLARATHRENERPSSVAKRERRLLPGNDREVCRSSWQEIARNYGAFAFESNSFVDNKPSIRQNCTTGST